MPLKRYELRNEYSLADPELYKVADKDDPEALLEGVAMAGLVGVLRQLGDLAEFAAEIFHDLHEEVMGTAARGHGLIVRVQQLEAECPLIERKLLSQMSHTSFLYNSSIDWHPNLLMDQNTVTQGDMPRFVMDSYEECRGPPRLFLLDKFDVGGAGACLKRFTDPSFFKVTYASSAARKSENQREKKTRKIKKRGPRWRNGDTPESHASSHAKLHQLFLEESIESGGVDPHRRVKLKKRQFTGSLFSQESAKSYMEKFLDTCPPEQRVFHEIIEPLPLTWTSNHTSDSGLEIVEIGTISPLKESMEYETRFCSSPDTKDIAVKQSVDEFVEGKHASETVEALELPWKSHNGDISSTITKVVSNEDLTDKESNLGVNVDVNSSGSDDAASGVGDYVDARATIESEVETDSESKKYPSYLNLKPVTVDVDGSLAHQESYGGFLDSQSISASSTSEESINFYEEKEISSCSNSVNASVGTTLDSDVVVVLPVTASNGEHEKFSDHHSESQDIIEREHVCAGASTTDSKTGQEVMEVSDISCLTKVLSVDMKAYGMGNSLELNEIYSRLAGSDVAPGERDPGHANAANWSSSASVLDVPDKVESANWSAKLPIHDKASLVSGVSVDTSSHSPKTSVALTNSPQLESQKVNLVCSSSEEHAKDTWIANEDGFFSEFTQSPEQPAISESELPEMVKPICDFPSVPCSQIPIIQVSSGSTDHERRVSSDTTAGQAELCPLFGNELQILSPELSSTGISDPVETAESGSFKADGADIALYGDLPNNGICLGYGDGRTVDSVMIGSVPFSEDHTEGKNLNLSSEIDDESSFLHFQAEGGEHGPESDTFIDGDSLYIDKDDSKAFTCPAQDKGLELVRYSDYPEIEAVDRLPSSKNSPMDLLGDDNVFSNKTLLSFPRNQADNLNSVEAAENGENVVFGVEKVELVQTVLHCPGATLDHDQSVIPSFSTAASPEKLPHFTTEVCHQNEYESSNRLGGRLNGKLQEDTETSFHQSHHNYVDSRSQELLKPVLPQQEAGEAQDIASDAKALRAHMGPAKANSHDRHVQNPESGEIEGLIDSASYNQSQPSVSKPPQQTGQQALGSATEAIMHSDVGNFDRHRPNEAIDVTQLEDHRHQVCSPDFLDFGSAPSESQLNLEPPPLPPLPPMQWRLGRFQNSSASPERQMVQQRVGHVQAQPVRLPALHHTLVPIQTISPAAVHNKLAPAQPIALPASQYILAPAQPMTLPAQLRTLAPVPQVILPNEAVTIAQTSWVEGDPGSSDGFMAPEGISLPLSTAASEGSFLIDSSANGRTDHLLLSVPSACNYMSMQEGFTLPLPATVSEGSQDNRIFFVHPTSIGLQSGTDGLAKLHQPNCGTHDSESFNESHASEQNVSVDEETVNPDAGVPNGLLDPQLTEQVMVNSYLQYPPPSRVRQPFAGFATSEADIEWLSAYDGVPTPAADNTNGALQKKLPRPRNPLIDEVVAIDKSKLRKVEKVKPLSASKSGEGESLREQLQLRRVEKVVPAVGTQASNGESILEQLQLRKVGERVKPSVESEDREFFPEQLKLRQVGDRVKSEVETRVEETESPRVQLRKVSQRLKHEVDTKIEETESPRVQLRKVGEKSQPVAGPTEERDSLLEQIRNKSFSLKPAVAARPNIQGPRTNLKVAAILEKASNIRQAMVGSDEDDDADTWSDC